MAKIVGQEIAVALLVNGMVYVLRDGFIDRVRISSHTDGLVTFSMDVVASDFSAVQAGGGQRNGLFLVGDQDRPNDGDVLRLGDGGRVL